MSNRTLVAIGVAVLIVGMAALLASGGDEDGLSADPIDEAPAVDYWQDEEPSDGAEQEPVDAAVEEPEESARTDLGPAARDDLELLHEPEGTLAKDAEPSPGGWRGHETEPAAEPPYAVIEPDDLVEPEPGADDALEPADDEAPEPEQLDDPTEDGYEAEEPALEVADDDAGAEDDVEPEEPYEDEEPLEPEEFESPDEPATEEDPEPWEQ